MFGLPGLPDSRTSVSTPIQGYGRSTAYPPEHVFVADTNFGNRFFGYGSADNVSEKLNDNQSTAGHLDDEDIREPGDLNIKNGIVIDSDQDDVTDSEERSFDGKNDNFEKKNSCGVKICFVWLLTIVGGLGIYFIISFIQNEKQPNKKDKDIKHGLTRKYNVRDPKPKEIYGTNRNGIPEFNQRNINLDDHSSGNLTFQYDSNFANRNQIGARVSGRYWDHAHNHPAANGHIDNSNSAPSRIDETQFNDSGEYDFDNETNRMAGIRAIEIARDTVEILKKRMEDFKRYVDGWGAGPNLADNVEIAGNTLIKFNDDLEDARLRLIILKYALQEVSESDCVRFDQTISQEKNRIERELEKFKEEVEEFRRLYAETNDVFTNSINQVPTVTSDSVPDIQQSVENSSAGGVLRGSNTSNEDHNDVCSICFDKVERSDPNAVSLPCQCVAMHHRECIKQWFETNPANPTCPCCRQEVPRNAADDPNNRSLSKNNEYNVPGDIRLKFGPKIRRIYKMIYEVFGGERGALYFPYPPPKYVNHLLRMTDLIRKTRLESQSREMEFSRTAVSSIIEDVIYNAVDNNIVSVVELLAQIKNLNTERRTATSEGDYPWDKNHTFLLRACYKGNKEILKHLVSIENIDLNSQSSVGATPLFLIVSGRFKSWYGDYVASRVADADQIEMVKILLESNSDLSQIHGNTETDIGQDGNSLSPVNNYNRIDLEAPDLLGKTPLLEAILKRRPEIVKLLLAAGANFDKRRLFRAYNLDDERTFNFTPLELARYNYNSDRWDVWTTYYDSEIINILEEKRRSEFTLREKVADSIQGYVESIRSFF